MDETEREQRIERRRRVVALLRAMASNDAKADSLVAELAADPETTRVVGALGVAGATLARGLSQASRRSVDAVLDELEAGLTAAPVD